MKIQISRSELLKVLKTAALGVYSGASPIAGTDCFTFLPGAIQAFSGSVYVSVSIDLHISGIIKADELVKVLEKMTCDEVMIEEKKTSIVFSGIGVKLEMTKVEGVFPAPINMETLEVLKWVELPEEFNSALSLVAPGASKIPSNGALTAIRIEGFDVWSCDNVRASWYKLTKEIPQMTLPGPTAMKLSEIQGLHSCTVQGSWAHFLNEDGVVFSCLLMGVDYPVEMLKKTFSDLKEIEWSELPEALGKTVEMASVMATVSQEDPDYLTLIVKDGFLEITGSRAAGSVTARTPAPESGWPEGVSISIQPKHLARITRTTRRFMNKERGMIFQAGEFTHLVLKVM
jgi:hypothetical protein